MNKITLKFLLIFLFMFSIFNTNAQEKITSVSNNKSVQSKNTVNTALQLTTESQRSLDETGYIRCASVEVHNSKLANNAARQQQYENAFENWLAPLVEAKRIEIAQQKTNGTFKKAVVNVPIIFHVISGSPGDASDISDALIQAQIDQLNLDFSNQGGVNGVASTHPSAADAEIVFVPATVDPNGNPLSVPGIDRVYGYPGDLVNTDYENTIKPATIWDRSMYANIWTGSLGGGLLGYAQFPVNSQLPGFPETDGPLTDGVVCAYGTIGSRDLPGSAPPYNLGRTLTHEIGHWIGLRHIWGDTTNCNGGQNAGDYCADTPDSTSSNFGCPNGTDKCTSDGLGNDMIENYMDYTDDSCMDIFTADQVLRIVTVLQNADGISNLPNSNTGDPIGPVVSYSSASSSQEEGSDCSFTDVTISLTIPVGASATATANFVVSGGTANNGVDFDLMTTSVSFAAGSTTASNDLVLRVYNDSFVEGDETITIDFTVNPNGGDATAGINSHTLTINDDDTVPVNTQNIILLDSDFETTDTTVWTNIDNDGTTANDWSGFNGVTYTGIDGVFMGSLSNDVLGGGANYSPDNFYYTGPITIPGDATNVNFNYGIGGYLDNEPYEVYWTTTNNPTAGTIVSGTLIDSGNSLSSAAEIKSIDLTTIEGQVGYFAVRHLSQGNGNSATDGILLLDNVSITATISKSIQTLVNTGTTNDQLNLLGTGTVYTADDSGDLMLDIVNNNTDDYGCVDVSVSRAGIFTQSYNGSTTNNLVLDKTFTITPTNISTSGDVTIDFYVTTLEMNGFIAGTGLTSNDVFAYREGSNDVVALTASAFGSDFKLSGNFTGLDGTYYLGAEGAFRVRIAPKVFLSGAYSGALMNDGLRSNSYIPTTSPYADALTCNTSVFNTTGNDAIVDWVWIELRDATTNTTVSASTSALLQRDGDVVNIDGISPLLINTSGKDYYVVINHRNHLGAMTLNTTNLSGTVVTVDFTSGLATFGSNAQKNMGSGIMGLWSGNVNGDTVVQYSGTTPDAPSILTNALNATGNFLNFPTYLVVGYDVHDVDMDGGAQYTGTTPDAPYVLQNVLAHPDNFLNFSTFAIQEQLPEN